MIDFLVKKFVPDHESINNPNVRKRYGLMTSIIGICCNIFLFILKFVIGTISGSISIISDAFNNLSDCANCMVSVFGFKFSAKPADKDHPYGHGRTEYLATLFIAVSIIVLGIELVKTSAERIIEPKKIELSAAVIISLVISIAVKLWMAHLNHTLGKRINSMLMLATVRDSLCDVCATTAAALGIILTHFTGLPFDGIMGILVALFVTYTGVALIKETLDLIIGEPVDDVTLERINEIVRSSEKVLGVHDVMVHDYGPVSKVGSCHVEVRSDEKLIEIHEVIDDIERKIFDELGVSMTIHMDPVEVDDPETIKCRTAISGILGKECDGVTIHDFRLVRCDGYTLVSFDLLKPYGCCLPDSEIKTMVDGVLTKIGDGYRSRITFEEGEELRNHGTS